MKKKPLFVLGAAVILTLSACSDELPKSITDVQESKEGKEKKDAKETFSNKTGFNVIEKQKTFGGGTFDIDNSKRDVGAIDVTELKDGIFLTVNNTNDYKYIIGDQKKWRKEISIDYFNQGIEIKGNKIFKEIDKKLKIKEYSFQKEAGEITTPNALSLPENGIFYTLKTSQGSGLLVKDFDTDIIKIYVDDKIVGEFKDEKDVFKTNVDRPEEFSRYFDVKNQKLYFANNIFIEQIDAKTGKPLFKDGKIKNIKAITNEVNILGDKNGNIYVMEANNDVTVAAYDKNLDPLTQKFTVPVKNPDLTTFTVANDELHFYSAYTYELEPMLELTRVSIPSFGKK